jgi:hypothetical protein
MLVNHRFMEPRVDNLTCSWNGDVYKRLALLTFGGAEGLWWVGTTSKYKDIITVTSVRMLLRLLFMPTRTTPFPRTVSGQYQEGP